MRECQHCGEREHSNERSFKYCGRCRTTLYCSRTCQRHDWPFHKLLCRPPKDNNKAIPECGLCGSRKGPFTRTECCNKLICDDEDSYVMFSYSRIHCSRNHRRYSQCAYHFTEHHEGRWQDCATCRGNDQLGSTLPDGSVNYDWAVRVGNHPDRPFRFNFEDDCLKFDWDRDVKYPCCSVCGRDVDTWMNGHSYGLTGITCTSCCGLNTHSVAAPAS